MEASLTSEEIKQILLILKGIQAGLIASEDWEEEVYEKALVNATEIKGITAKLEHMIPESEAREVEKVILLRRFDEYHSQVDESVYSKLKKAFTNTRRIETKYFSLRLEDFTNRQ